MTAADATEARARRPTLREQNRSRTRQAILEACVEIELLHGGFANPELFTYARIAEVAGVSERTVYRMFPTKAELVHAYLADRTLLRGRVLPSSLDEYPDLIRELTREWSARYPDPVARHDPPGTGEYPEAQDDQRRRDELVARQAADLIPPTLPDRQRLAITAILQSVASIRSLATAASRWQLTLAEAGEAQAWALEAMLDSLRERPPEPWTDPPTTEPSTTEPS